MPRVWSIRLQSALVIGMFFASLAIVVDNAFQTLRLPREESDAADRLREASRLMAEAAQSQSDRLNATVFGKVEEISERLRQISNQLLAAYPGVEGGFYLATPIDRFAGYGYPTESLENTPQRLESAVRSRGDEPPPKEAAFILVQVRQSLASGSDESQLDTRTVGQSRVAIVTQPVGPRLPARLAAWTMYRITSPQSLAEQLKRFQWSTGMALVGIAIAVALSANLGLTYQRQRREKERLRDELRRSEHLAAIGKLLAGVAHEVRNPLAGIRSTVQLWERLPETARTPESIEAVAGAVDRLNDIVTRLLYFARTDNTERRPTSVNSILTELLNLIEAQASAQCVTIERDLDSELPIIDASSGGLRQAFLNLLTNAIQAQPQGGRIVCSTRLLQTDRGIEISIQDSGSGVTPEVRKHLFEPFYTTRPNGTGLGLAICHEIVAQHGGRIELLSAGGGTTFRIVLPIPA
jgi:two-component system sensor histidine kinase HydH